MATYNPFDYIRDYYGVPARKGAQVIYRGRKGKVTGASNQYVMIKLDGEKFSKPYHPRDDDLKWLENELWPTIPAST